MLPPNYSVGANSVTYGRSDISTAIAAPTARDCATEHGECFSIANNFFTNLGDSYKTRPRIANIITDGGPVPYGTNHWSSRIVKQTVDKASY